MATTNLFNVKRGDIKNQDPGYRNLAYIATLDQFTTIAVPLPAAVGAASQEIEDDHVFVGTVGTNGFYQCYLMPNKTEAPGESTGEEGGSSMIWKPKIFIPGDTAAVQAMVNALLNDDIVLLLQDSNCPGGGLRQYGGACYQAHVEKVNFGSGVTNSGTTKGWELSLTAKNRYFYNGTVEIHPD